MRVYICVQLGGEDWWSTAILKSESGSGKPLTQRLVHAISGAIRGKGWREAWLEYGQKLNMESFIDMGATFALVPQAGRPDRGRPTREVPMDTSRSKWSSDLFSMCRDGDTLLVDIPWTPALAAQLQVMAARLSTPPSSLEINNEPPSSPSV